MVQKKTIYIAVGIIAVIIIGFVIVNANSSGANSTTTLVVKPIDFVENVSISGNVKAAQTVRLGFDQSGRIAGIYANVGDSVATGTLIANIENEDLRANLATEAAKLQSLLAGTRPEQLSVTASKLNSASTSLANATLDATNAVNNAYTKVLGALVNNVDQFFNNPQSVNPTITLPAQSYTISNNINNERAAVSSLFVNWKSHTTTISQAIMYVRSVSNFINDLTAITNNLSAGGTSLSQTTINNDIAAVNNASIIINQAISDLTNAQSALQNAQSAYDESSRMYALDAAGSRSEDVIAAQAQVQSAQGKLNKTLVTAPFSGIITKMDAKVGEVVAPGASEMAMMSNGIFQIESYVPEVYIAGVALGNKATLTLDAYGPDVPFAAHVIAIDPAETIRDGVSTYKVTFEFDTNDSRIKSGMTANINLTTADRKNAIVIPASALTNTTDSNGNTLVTVKVKAAGAATFTSRTVTVGSITTLGQAIITSGLQSGDEIQLGTK